MSEKRSTRGKFLALLGVGGAGAVVAAPDSARAHHTSGRVRDEGVLLPHRETIDFRGAGVAATDDAAGGRTRVTVPGSTGGGGATPTDVGMDLARDFGVTGYLPSENKRDESAGIQQAMDTLVREGGTLHVNPHKRYFHQQSIVVNNTAKPWRITGQGGWHHQNVDLTTFVYGGGQGAPPGWDVQSTFGFEIDRLRFSHDNPAFDGLQMDLDWGAPAMDPMLWYIHDCGFNALVESNARAGLRLNHAIIGSVERNHFGRFRHSIQLAEPGGTYVVGVTIAGNTFNFYREAAIAIGSADLESVTIGFGNVFEDPSGATAIKGLPGNACYNLGIENNWWGDSGGGTWIGGLNSQSNHFPCWVKGERMANNTRHFDGLNGHWTLEKVSTEGGIFFNNTGNVNLSLRDCFPNNPSSLWGPGNPEPGLLRMSGNSQSTTSVQEFDIDAAKSLLVGGASEVAPVVGTPPPNGMIGGGIMIGRGSHGALAPFRKAGAIGLYTLQSGSEVVGGVLQGGSIANGQVILAAGHPTAPVQALRIDQAGGTPRMRFFNDGPMSTQPTLSDNPTNAEIAAALKQLGLCR